MGGSVAKANGAVKIEKGIPVPPQHKGSGITAVMRQLNVGDSFLYPLRKRNGISAFARAIGIKTQTRTVDQNNVRVWRIK